MIFPRSLAVQNQLTLLNVCPLLSKIYAPHHACFASLEYSKAVLYVSPATYVYSPHLPFRITTKSTNWMRGIPRLSSFLSKTSHHAVYVVLSPEYPRKLAINTLCLELRLPPSHPSRLCVLFNTRAVDRCQLVVSKKPYPRTHVFPSSRKFEGYVSALNPSAPGC
jgi:hypothetical protein